MADSEALAHPLAEPWAELLRSVQQKGGYSHVIASSTSFGKNLLPRAAALLDVSPVTDVTAVKEPHVFVRSGILLFAAIFSILFSIYGPIFCNLENSPCTSIYKFLFVLIICCHLNNC